MLKICLDSKFIRIHQDLTRHGTTTMPRVTMHNFRSVDRLVWFSLDKKKLTKLSFFFKKKMNRTKQFKMSFFCVIGRWLDISSSSFRTFTTSLTWICSHYRRWSEEIIKGYEKQKIIHADRFNRKALHGYKQRIPAQGERSKPQREQKQPREKKAFHCIQLHEDKRHSD